MKWEMSHHFRIILLKVKLNYDSFSIYSPFLSTRDPFIGWGGEDVEEKKRGANRTVEGMVQK